MSSRNAKRVTGAIAALAAVATGLLVTAVGTASAAPLPANTASSGSVTIAPASGTRTSSYGFTLPGGASCPGDGTAGYRWQTYIISDALDASQLTFVGGSPSITGAPAGSVVDVLYSLGNPIVDQNPALTTGAVTVAGTQFQNDQYLSGQFSTGIYKTGVACTDGNGNTQRFWQSKVAVTVTAGVISSWAVANPPAAPVLSAPSFATAGTFSGTVAVTAANPAITSVVLTATSSNGGVTGSQTISGSVSYTTSALAISSIVVTATPVTAGSPVSTTINNPAASPVSYSISGLTNGTSYNITAVANNAAGASAVSNTVSNVLVFDVNSKGAPGVVATPAVGGATLAITAPAGGQPNDYTLTVSPAIAGSPFTVPGNATSFTITSATAGVTYTATLQPNYTAPAVGTATTFAFVPQSATLITQTIDVTRPLGGLVLTQRCGVYGALPAENATNAFPAATPAAFVGTQDPNAPGLLTGGTSPTIPGGGTDPNFGQYPYPVDANGVPSNPGAVTYPTNCGLSLGTAQLITTGSEAGKYFRASGRMNQVTVVDTRNVDAGWTLQGSMTDFASATSADTFSGNYLGWTPVRTYDSGATLEGYDMITTAGTSTQPDFLTGMKASPKVLGSALANQGLGIAAFDARLRLLIPVTKDNGVYTATLTLSVV